MSNKLLLCVDDEPSGLLVRKILLENCGYRVITATGGPEGLQHFQQEPVDLVVLDYFMPGMHGGEVATQMRKLKPHVPILMLSAYLDLPAGALDKVDAFVTKGQAPQELLGKIAELVHGGTQALAASS